MKALLDTHILLWWFSDQKKLSVAQKRVLSKADPGHPLLLSDISLWEIATLVELGRIHLDLPLRDWLERATAEPLVRRCGITPAIAATVATLSTTFQRDPADRILVATALVHGATLVTQDERIVDSKLVPTLI